MQSIQTRRAKALKYTEARIDQLAAVIEERKQRTSRDGSIELRTAELERRLSAHKQVRQNLIDKGARGARGVDQTAVAAYVPQLSAVY